MGQWEKRMDGTGRKGKRKGKVYTLYVYLFFPIFISNFQAHRKIETKEQWVTTDTHLGSTSVTNWPYLLHHSFPLSRKGSSWALQAQIQFFLPQKKIPSKSYLHYYFICFDFSWLCGFAFVSYLLMTNISFPHCWQQWLKAGFIVWPSNDLYQVHGVPLSHKLERIWLTGHFFFNLFVLPTSELKSS